MSNDINHHVVIYKRVFYALLVLTALTVGVTYVHFEVYWVGLFIGLLIVVSLPIAAQQASSLDELLKNVEQGKAIQGGNGGGQGRDVEAEGIIKKCRQGRKQERR